MAIMKSRRDRGEIERDGINEVGPGQQRVKRAPMRWGRVNREDETRIKGRTIRPFRMFAWLGCNLAQYIEVDPNMLSYFYDRKNIIYTII
jgi:hypothetical protein